VRVLVIGPPAERARLIARLPADLEVVGEVQTLAEARETSVSAEAWLVAPAGDNDRSDDLSGTEPLTPRELEVVELLAQGLSNKAIAARLGISDQTVKFHVASICGKLGAANRTEAAHRALRLGVIPL
jgi:DNA-binding NarL/FixJ family response regulator